MHMVYHMWRPHANLQVAGENYLANLITLTRIIVFITNYISFGRFIIDFFLLFVVY
jgi:hypothetical protein